MIGARWVTALALIEYEDVAEVQRDDQFPLNGGGPIEFAGWGTLGDAPPWQHQIAQADTGWLWMGLEVSF